jgi:hypothetical protein
MMLIALAMSVGCAKPTSSTIDAINENYNKFTLREGDARFSFEYPTNYEEMVTYLHVGDETPAYVFGRYTAVSFDRSIVEENQLLERSYLHVAAREASSLDNSDAKAALEDEIAKFATSKNNRDFEIIDRSPVTIAGVVGERVEFSYCQFQSDPFIEYEGPYVELPITSIVRYVCFDHDGFVWSIFLESWPIFLESTEGLAEEDGVHFEHILETFTILD